MEKERERRRGVLVLEEEGCDVKSAAYDRTDRTEGVVGERGYLDRLPLMRGRLQMKALSSEHTHTKSSFLNISSLLD